MEADKPEIVPEKKKKLEIVIVSDTHGDFKPFKQLLNMKGDIFIHAGDFTEYGREEDFVNFFRKLDRLNFKHKIVIAGNHEISLDNGCITKKKKEIYLNRYKCKVQLLIFSSQETKSFISSKKDVFILSIKLSQLKESLSLDHLTLLTLSEMPFNIESGTKKLYGMPCQLTWIF